MTEAEARFVLSHGPWGWLAPRTPLRPIPTGSGFSEAVVVRFEDAHLGDLCLRGSPVEGNDEFLETIHDRMRQARQAGLDFIPRVIGPPRGAWCTCFGRRWELLEWMQGSPATGPAHPAQIRSACTALARLHAAWSPPFTTPDPIPGVQRRFRTAGELLALLERETAGPPRILRLLKRWLPAVPEMLRDWAHRRFPLQTCHGDLWSAHVLFAGDAVGGIIDFASVRTDHVAADLARLLGDFAEDDEERWQAGSAAYRSVRSLEDMEAELARIMDRTGTILAVGNWYRWLVVEKRTIPNEERLSERLLRLCARMERW